MAHGAVGEMFVVDCLVRERHARARAWSAGDFQSGSKTAACGRRFGAGSRWQSRHHPMVSGAACRISGMCVDRAVAGRAADAFGDVDGMIEIDVVRQLVDFVPMDRLVRRRDSRAPAPASRSGCKAASGRSCRCESAGCRRRRTSRRRCGSSGNRDRARRHDARG